MNEHLAEIRRLLTRLKARLAEGEIGLAELEQRRATLLEDLSEAELRELGFHRVGEAGTPMPISAVGARTPPPAAGGTGAFGPGGGLGDGMRTKIERTSVLNLAEGSRLFDRWRVVRELGRGGFGIVVEVEDEHLGERRALKVLDPQMVERPELLARFRREVAVMQRLLHPRIVRVFDYREEAQDGLAALSMELVSGGSVRDLRLATPDGRLPVSLVSRLLAEILEGLAEAHRQGVMHRDVTPANVLLAGGPPSRLLADPTLDPGVKLADFGIAGLLERSELSERSRVLGTAAYVAPEVLTGGQVGAAADVYGAAAVAYELLVGRPPVGRFETARVLRADVPDSLDALLGSMLATDPAQRPSAAQALEALAEPPPAQVRATQGAARPALAETQPASGTDRAATVTQEPAKLLWPAARIRTAAVVLAVCLLVAAAGWRLASGPAAVHRRALAIGNAGYESVPRLVNPTNDAGAVGAALRGAGFETELLLDAGREGMMAAITRWSRQVAEGDTAVIFYSGHAVECDGAHLLIPVDFSGSDLQAARGQAVNAQELLDLTRARRPALIILVLDTDRNCPFPGPTPAGRQQSVRVRQGVALARFVVPPLATPVLPEGTAPEWVPVTGGMGTYVVFATSPGGTASDQPADPNGLFTRFFAAAVEEPGLALEPLLERVGAEVMAASQGRQKPVWQGSAAKRFYFRPPG